MNLFATTSVRTFAAVTFALTFTACADPSDKPTEVKDLRVLAIAADPPEVLFDRTTGWSAPQVTWSALVADPRGGEPATFHWRFCPVDSGEACTDYIALREQAPAPMRPMLEALFGLSAAGQALVMPSDGVGQQAIEGFAAAWPADLFSYHFADSGLGIGNGAWPSAVLTVDGHGNKLVVQKRVTLNAADLSQWNPELRATFGFAACEANTPTPGCLPLRPKVPNQNPQITAVSVARGATAGITFVPVQGVLQVHANEVVRIAPTLSPAAFEPYQAVESTLQDDKLVIRELIEQPVVSWFATDGELTSERTAAALTKSFDNTFTAPAIPPAATAGLVSLWMVVRDLRGGTGWQHLGIQVIP